MKHVKAVYRTVPESDHGIVCVSRVVLCKSPDKVPDEAISQWAASQQSINFFSEANLAHF